MWWPQVTLANMVDKPTKWEPGLIIRADGQVTYIQRFRAIFETKFKLAAFPFDSQTMPIKVLLQRESIGQAVLVQDQKDVDASRISPGASVAGWSLRRLDFTPASVIGWNGQYFSELDAGIRARRNPVNHIPLIFVPFALILVVPTVLSLFTRGDAAPRLTAWGQAILAMIAFNFTISVRYPGMGSDTFISELLFLGFGFQTFMVVLTASYFNTQYTGSLGGEDLVTEITSFFRWAAPLGFIGLIVVRILLTMSE